MIQLTQGYSLRLANLEDYHSVYYLVQEGLEELRPLEEVDQDHLGSQLQQTLQRPLQEGVVLVLEIASEIVGCLTGQKTFGHFSSRSLAVESHYFVKRNHRGVNSLKLLEAFEEWSRRVGCSEVYLSSGNDPRFAKLLKRKGYHEDKVIYKKVL